MPPLTTDPEPNAVQVTNTEDGITIITLNRPQRKNAVDLLTSRKLHHAFKAFENDPVQKVAILHGANGTFCAGFDLQHLSRASSSGDDQNASLHPVNGTNPGPMGPSRMQLRKPLISAVSGFAVAGGLELSLVGDMRVVEEDAVFGVFCRRFGVPLIDGGTVRLQRVVGLGRALDMILTGRPVKADEAYIMGLANRVVPKGKALEEALGLARQLVGFPQGCLNVDRASCYFAAYGAGSFEEGLRVEFEDGAKVVETESVQGARRFAAGEGRHGGFEKAKL